jgi:hypothetical protein
MVLLLHSFYFFDETKLIKQLYFLSLFLSPAPFVLGQRELGKEKLTNNVVKLYTYLSTGDRKVALSLVECKAFESLKVYLLEIELSGYYKYLKKFTDQLDRRILHGEKIPHIEKVFSIFEPEVEWEQKVSKTTK